MGNFNKTLSEAEKVQRQRTGFLSKLSGAAKNAKLPTERELIAKESAIGGQLFGPVAKGVRREFFNVDPQTWIWHEEAYNRQTKREETRTVKYEIQHDHILKVEEGAHYTKVEGVELKNFVLATHAYYERTMREIYNRDPKTGKKLS